MARSRTTKSEPVPEPEPEAEPELERDISPEAGAEAKTIGTFSCVLSGLNDEASVPQRLQRTLPDRQCKASQADIVPPRPVESPYKLSGEHFWPTEGPLGQQTLLSQ